MIPREMAKKLRYLEIFTRRSVDAVLAGEYRSAFKGQGIEFDEVREYQPGDDVRAIDWNVTARMGHPFIKRFVEERELTVMLLVDLSASNAFGSTANFKSEVAAEICALLAFSAIKNQDRVGLIGFTDRIEMAVAPAKGGSHALRFVHDLWTFKPRQSPTNLAAATDYLRCITTRRAVVFVLSDFLDVDFEKALRVLSHRHDTNAVCISDSREMAMPNVGLVELKDAETGELLLLDTAHSGIREQYSHLSNSRLQRIRELLRWMDVGFVEISPGSDYVVEFATFLRRLALR